MLEKIKQNLFTIHGIVTSLIHIFLIIGILGSWVFINVTVLGHDVAVAFPTPRQFKK